MKKINLRTVLMSVVILLFGFAGYSLGKEQVRANDVFFCTANFNTHSGDEMLSLSINYNLNHGNGYITMNGTYFKDGIKKSDIDLKKEFLYTQEDGEFSFTEKPNGVMEVNDGDPQVLRKFLSDFYFTRNVGTHHVRIKQIRPGVWIFTTTPTPYMICSEY